MKVNIHENKKNEKEREEWEFVESIERERVQEKVEKSGNDDDPENDTDLISINRIKIPIMKV